MKQSLSRDLRVSEKEDLALKFFQQHKIKLTCNLYEGGRIAFKPVEEGSIGRLPRELIQVGYNHLNLLNKKCENRFVAWLKIELMFSILKVYDSELSEQVRKSFLDKAQYMKSEQQK